MAAKSKTKKDKLFEENYHFLCGATEIFLDALFLGVEKRLGDELFQKLLAEYRNRTEFEEVLFFKIAPCYCSFHYHSIDDLKEAFMNSVADSEMLLWMLDMLDNLKNVPDIKRSKVLCPR
jgi:hypothetical protein